MAHMITVVPNPLTPGSVVVGDEHTEGITSDISVQIRSDDGQLFTVRTSLRTGERMDPNGFVHGVMTDTVAIATLSVAGLLLQSIASGLSDAETRKLMHAALADADTLARDHEGWSFSPMLLDGVTFALRYRILEQGFVAHADTGDSAVSAWGPGDLPAELGQTQRVDSRSLGAPLESAHSPD